MTTAIWKQAGTGTTVRADAPCFLVHDAEAAARYDIAETLANAALAGDPRLVDAAIDAALVLAIEVDRLLVGTVTAAARRLGDFWVEDSCDFVAVTTAMWQLRRGVERVIDAHPLLPPQSGRRAVFAAAPGDQHGFGTFLVAEVFARAGWSAVPVDGDELVALVADEWIDLVGLTATADRHRGALAPAIATLRAVSRNPRLAIMVGGRVFLEDLTLAAAIGADGTAPDALAALALADALVAPPGLPC